MISVRSASAKRAVPQDQASTSVSKHASPKCAEDRPVHAQDLEVLRLT